MASYFRVILFAITIIVCLGNSGQGEKVQRTSRSPAAHNPMTSSKLRTRLMPTSSPSTVHKSKGKNTRVMVVEKDLRLDNVNLDATEPGPGAIRSTASSPVDERRRTVRTPSTGSGMKIKTPSHHRSRPAGRISTPRTLTTTTSMTPTTKVTTAASPGRRQKTGLSIRGDGCPDQCDTILCAPVEAETCRGRVVKDQCNCCPMCNTTAAQTFDSNLEFSNQLTSQQSSNVCESLTCPRNKVCILNIQGIPMCRCPNVYSCKNVDRRPLCTVDGVWFKNKCFLKAEECVQGRKLRVAHKGACRTTPMLGHSPDGDRQQTTETVRARHIRKMATVKTKMDEKHKRRHSDKYKYTERKINKKGNYA